MNGSAVQIKDNILKVVNYESVFDNLEDKISANKQATRLLFRQRRMNNADVTTITSNAVDLGSRSPSKLSSPIKKYLIKPRRLQPTDNSFLK